MSKLKKPYVFLNPSAIHTVIGIIKKVTNTMNNAQIQAINNKEICVEF